MTDMAPNESRINTDESEIYVNVDVQKLPSFSKLNEKVQKVVKSSSTWDLYGVDLCVIFISIATVPIALHLLQNGGWVQWILATFILGTSHTVITANVGHISTHGGIYNVSKRMVNVLNVILVDFLGGYSSYMARTIHIDIHHPYTNIIGLGDSTAWKAPFLDRVTYLFVMPLLLPIITPLVAIYQLLFEEKKYVEFFKFFPILISGFVFHIYFFVTFANFTITSSILYIFLYRAVFQIPYIHLNIFQHIGLPMYSQKSKPTNRIYLMSTGVLNLSRNWLLDWVFGHSLINCHVEHHLFPRLSNNMCLKVKPIVSKYLKENGLCYNEDSYMNRLKDFYNRYDELMVHAPPITHFAGIQ